MDFFAKTDKGQRRRMNQDYVFASDQPVGTLPNLFLLADGMGGHKAGDYASRYAVDELRRYIEKAAQPQPEIRLLQEGIRDVNQRLYRLAQQNPNLSGMGTTLVIALIEGPNLTVGNIGDSRAYLIQRPPKRLVSSTTPSNRSPPSRGNPGGADRRSPRCRSPSPGGSSPRCRSSPEYAGRPRPSSDPAASSPAP